MKKVFLVIIIMLAVASMASAELLVTANPIGKGKWAFSLIGLQSSNVSNTSGYTMANFGGYAGYGVIDNLDLFISVATGVVGGLPSVGGIQAASSLTSYGLTGKYTLLNEGPSMPVSVALGLGYRSLSTKATTPAFIGGNFVGVDSTTSGSQIFTGVGVSKILAPFIPYAALMYRSTDNNGSMTQIDLTAGTAVAWSMQGAVLAEYTLQSITPNGGSNYSSGQMAASVAYKL